MAIIDTLPAVEVSVRLERGYRDADEYPDPYPYYEPERYMNDSERCARNYIESKNGAEFAVHIKVLDNASIDSWVHRSEGLIFLLFLDGHFMGRRFCYDDEFKDGSWQFAFKGKRHPNQDRTSMVESNFKFETVTAVDQDVTDGDFRRAKNLGTIEVRVRLARFAGVPRRNRRVNLERPFREPQYNKCEISEEAIKGRPIHHGTSFTQPVNMPLRPPRKMHRAAIEQVRTGALFATYMFKYRSREALKIEKIVPQTPGPEPIPMPPFRQMPAYLAKSSLPRFEDLHDDEVERLARERHQQLQDERAQPSTQKKKRSYGDFCDLTEDADERSTRPYKIIKLRNGHDAFDLTGGY
ncbi:hypothetical protein CORC01_07031 [Colletotrichum orchidophilum]|uniref:DUF7918 domain-containing protein n=1 Tax=Colletotrichum orchidophilum TaxID=1209926 RepID=A0A1G4B8G3_9PEZI|nr:uncharacterized protein CORC01_07031 [Colletotrichum orchidophilum]OHE97616.1 hypothetical protein CORC01_07031 [Colletotrichum orchidophilum]